jgi:hypothetical protein
MLLLLYGTGRRKRGRTNMFAKREMRFMIEEAGSE